MIRGSVFVVFLAFSTQLLAGTIEGLWKRQGEPVWIQFEANSNSGVVVRNDKNPDAVGFAVVRNLEVQSATENTWRAEVFAPPLGEYKPAEITLFEEIIMRFKVKIGFISRSAEWERVTALPDK